MRQNEDGRCAGELRFAAVPPHTVTTQLRSGQIWHLVAFKKHQAAVDMATTDGMEGRSRGGEAGRRCCSHLHVYSSAAGKVQRLFVCI